MNQLVGGLGFVLLIGGLAHSAGVVQLYLSHGVPDANRVLLDVWIAEAQLLGGALYVAASRSRRSGKPWRALATFGALIVIGYTASVLPVLLFRAPARFLFPVSAYLVLSLIIVGGSARS